MHRFRNIWRKTLKAGHSSSITELTKPNSIIPWLKTYSHNLFQSKDGLSDHTARRWYWLQSLQLFGPQPLPKLSGAENSHAIPIATAAASSEVGKLGWKAKLTPDLQYDLTAAFRSGSPIPIPDLCTSGELGGAGVVASSAVHGNMRHPKKAKQQAVGRVGQMKKTPLPRSIVQVLDTGMRPGMMPQTHGPVSSSYGDAAKLEQLNKLWHRRGLGRNKVLPGATWSLRRLKLDRAEASKLERHHRASATANEHPGATLNCFAPLARVGMAADAFSDNGVLARILAGHHDAPLAAKLLEWAKQQHWYTADTRTYAELIRIMAWAGEADAAEELLQEMHFLAGSPDGDTFLVVLLVFSRMGRLSDAIRLLGDALKLGHRLDRKIVKVITYLSLKSGSPSDRTLLLQTLSLNRHLVGPSDCFENRLRQMQSPPENSGSIHVH